MFHKFEYRPSQNDRICLNCNKIQQRHTKYQWSKVVDYYLPLIGRCKPPAEIYHAVKDESDPSWKGWDIIRASGRADPGQAFSLGHIREVFKVKLHRGLHPEVGHVVNIPLEIIRPGWYRVYWFEVKRNGS